MDVEKLNQIRVDINKKPEHQPIEDVVQVTKEILCFMTFQMKTNFLIITAVCL